MFLADNSQKKGGTSASTKNAIDAVPTDVAGFVGLTESGPYRPQRVTSMAQFEAIFGAPTSPEAGFLPYAMRGFFDNGGRRAYVARVGASGKSAVPATEFIGNRRAKPELRHGLAGLMDIAEFSLLALPDLVHPRVSPKARAATLAAAVAQCVTRHDRVLFLDPPAGAADLGKNDSTIAAIDSSYAAVYGPWLQVSTDRHGMIALPPSGHVAGVYARHDGERGVWHAPAGTRAEVRGIAGLTATLSDGERRSFTESGINVIQDFRRLGRGIVLWGARTHCADAHWQYMTVRRLAILIESSIRAGTRWVADQPNGQNLWAKVRAAVENFLADLRRKRALQGIKPHEAFFVRCDPSTMSSSDISKGLLVCRVGFAPLRPGEFIEIEITLATQNAQRPGVAGNLNPAPAQEPDRE